MVLRRCPIGSGAGRGRLRQSEAWTRESAQIQSALHRQVTWTARGRAVMTVAGDYYEALGVSRDADAETIKSAFRRLAHRYHPDVSTEPDAEQRFREIAEAYGVLSDPAKRASYDAHGSSGVAGATAKDLWGDIDFADIFGVHAPTFGDLFGRLFGPAATGPQPLEDVRLDLSISLEEVMTGADHLVTIRRPVMCPECAGRGHVMAQLCRACSATGWTMRNETVTIRIPPGIPDGATLRLASQGLSRSAPGRAGDVYVTIRTRPDSQFRRVGADLWHDLHLPAPDAALGVTTTVPLPGGQARVRVPPGTQPGSVLRVAGKGLPRSNGDGRGNLQLTIILDIPRQLSPSQRRLYELLRSGDAESTAEVAGEPDAPRADQKVAAIPGGQHATGRSPLVFASVLMLLATAASLVVGIAAVSGSSVLGTGTQQVGGPSSWGWIMIMVGAVQLVAAAVLWATARTRR